MQEKTEKPTAKKLRDARKRGEVVKSPLVIQTASLILLTLFLALSAPAAMAWLAEAFERVAHAVAQPTMVEVPGVAYWIVVKAAWAVLAVLGVTAIGAAIGAFLQVRGVFSTEALKPKFERMNPGTNLKNVFSAQQLVQLVKSLLQIALLGGAFFFVIRANLPNLLRARETDAGTLVSMSARLLLLLVLVAIGVSLVLAVVDYGIHHFQFMKKQRMSVQEIRYEHKDVEGDPHVKSMRRRLHRSMSQAPLRQQVQRANLVVTNPTHLAVGLRYVPGTDELPRVVVKGADRLAAEIRSIAEASSIPVIRSPRLARALFTQIDEEAFISDEFFDAVAAVLAAAEEALH